MRKEYKLQFREAIPLKPKQLKHLLELNGLDDVVIKGDTREAGKLKTIVYTVDMLTPPEILKFLKEKYFQSEGLNEVYLSGGVVPLDIRSGKLLAVEKPIALSSLQTILGDPSMSNKPAAQPPSNAEGQVKAPSNYSKDNLQKGALDFADSLNTSFEKMMEGFVKGQIKEMEESNENRIKELEKASKEKVQDLVDGVRSAKLQLEQEASKYSERVASLEEENETLKASIKKQGDQIQNLKDAVEIHKKAAMNYSQELSGIKQVKQA